MCSISEQIEQACGLILLKDFNTFIYFCTKCQSEFLTGTELEVHILFYHQDEKKYIDGIFVNDGVLDASCGVSIVSLDPEIPQSFEEIESISDQLGSTGSIVERNHEEIEKNPLLNDSDSVQQTEKVLNLDYQRLSPPESNKINISDDVPTKGQPVSPTHIEQHKAISKQKRNRKLTSGILYCEMCPGAVFTSIGSIRHHMGRHAKNQVSKRCDICQIKPRNYEKHMKTNHLEIKPYKCDFCDSAFKSNTSRVIHMRTHTGDRPFLCASCGKSFKSQDTRKQHSMRMHNGTLPHLCSECGRSFMTPSQLQEHTFSFHSDIRLYTCDACGHQFKTKKYLRKHMQSHGEKIHSCKYCEKKFKTTETRRWHERTVHKAT